MTVSDNSTLNRTALAHLHRGLAQLKNCFTRNPQDYDAQFGLSLSTLDLDCLNDVQRFHSKHITTVRDYRYLQFNSFSFDRMYLASNTPWFLIVCLLVFYGKTIEMHSVESWTLIFEQQENGLCIYGVGRFKDDQIPESTADESIESVIVRVHCFIAVKLGQAPVLMRQGLVIQEIMEPEFQYGYLHQWSLMSSSSQPTSLSTDILSIGATAA